MVVRGHQRRETGEKIGVTMRMGGANPTNSVTINRSAPYFLSAHLIINTKIMMQIPITIPDCEHIRAS